MIETKKCVAILWFMVCSTSSYACENEYPADWDKVVVEILKYDQDDSSFQNYATGIFVLTYDSVCKAVLVTNRHILQSEHLWIRVNLKDTSLKKVDTISLEERYSLREKVIYPLDQSLDLAALPIPTKGGNWDVKLQSKSLIAQITELKRGTEVYFLGFPAGISVEHRSVPVYRQGVIALDQEYLDQEYLVDAMVIPGSSGSPVFSCGGKFVGLLYSHINYYNYDSKRYAVYSPTTKINAKLRINAGLGRMIPIDRIREFIVEAFPAWADK